MKKIKIAIDGPAGAGKSSVSKLVASKLNYSYVDTGAIYRSLAYLMGDKVKVTERDKILKLLENFNISFQMEGLTNHIFLNGVEITSQIRREDTGMTASAIAALPFVREALLETQQKYAASGGVVMEGRDVGAIVMPDAELKIFLTASLEKRAERRMSELAGKGITVSLEETINDMKKRDEMDSTRKIAPLKRAKDAILIDNSNLNLEQTADLIVAYAKEKF